MRKMNLEKVNFKVVLLFVLLVLNANTFSAQGISAQLSQVEVDNLTDEQVASYSSRIKSEGYTIEQALAIAKTRGMSEIQAQKLKARLRNLGTTNTNSNSILILIQIMANPNTKMNTRAEIKEKQHNKVNQTSHRCNQDNGCMSQV